MGKRCTKWVGDQHPPATSTIFSTSFYIFSLFPIFFCLQFKTLDAFLGIFIVSSISCFASVPSGGFFVANLFFLSTNLLLHIIRGPVYITSIFIYIFVLHFFVIYSHIFLILVYNKNMYICMYVCTFFLYISLALLLIIIFIYSSFSSFIFCYRHSCVLRYVSFCFSTLVNRKK